MARAFVLVGHPLQSPHAIYVDTLSAKHKPTSLGHVP
jgi:hypothetical protein